MVGGLPAILRLFSPDRVTLVPDLAAFVPWPLDPDTAFVTERGAEPAIISSSAPTKVSFFV